MNWGAQVQLVPAAGLGQTAPLLAALPESYSLVSIFSPQGLCGGPFHHRALLGRGGHSTKSFKYCFAELEFLSAQLPLISYGQGFLSLEWAQMPSVAIEDFRVEEGGCSQWRQRFSSVLNHLEHT